MPWESVVSNIPLERIQKGDKRITVRLGEVPKPLLRVRSLAVVPEDGFLEISGAAVVEEEGVAVHRLGEADPSKSMPPRSRAVTAVSLRGHWIRRVAVECRCLLISIDKKKKRI